jgi:hypothetical protein
MQGYFYSRPVPPAECEQFLRPRKRRKIASAT